MPDNPLLLAALYYVGRNWPVFPIWWVKDGRCACGRSDCAHPGKHPIGKLATKGRNSATADPKIIKEWWKQYPKANIGLPTGPESGLVVVDIDPRNGGNRNDLEKLGNFPHTPTAKTGGGGEHILLSHPGRKIKSKSKLGRFRGIDQKGNGGYIVAPPSNHFSGGVYSWKINPDTPLGDIPDWLMSLLLQEEERRQDYQGGPQAETPAPHNTGQSASDHEAYAKKALADELAKLARTPEGNRNNQLNKSAKALGELVGAGVLDRGVVEAGLMGAARSIGLSGKETRATIRSGLEAGIKEPRKLPEKKFKASRQKGNGTNGGGPTSPKDEEPKKIYWVGHYYFEERGRLCLETYDRQGMPQTRPLANFTARITDDISRDDGQQLRREFHLEGRLDSGVTLPVIKTPANKFDSLSWLREWGAAVSVAPGTSLRPHVCNAISALSHAAGIKRSTIYTKTGWQQIKGVWRYLHGAGAIGAGNPVEVALGENLQHYRLPAPGGVKSAQASLRFLDIAPWEVTAPLLACSYLAPFADLLKIDFSLWLFGPTGSFKTTLAALVLCHFGNFDRLTLPGSWLSTANSLEKLCFTLKDSLIVVDDFMPAVSAKVFHDMSERAGRLVYQAGNRSSRGRLAPDLSARPNYYPRGLILSTGEVLLPGQRQSATARYLGIELDPQKAPIDKARLTAAQEEAHLYAGAMAAYLEDLAPRLDEAQEEIRALFSAYRGAFQNGNHARIPEIQSWLAVGFEYCLRFQVRIGAVSQDEADRMLNQAWKVFEALGEAHAQRIEGERPVLKFLAILTELFLTRRIFAESAGSSALSHGAKPPREHLLGWIGNDTGNAYPVGYADETMVFLLPDTALRAVSEAVRAQGDYLSLGKNELLAALAREGFIETGKDGKHTQVKWIQGGSKRVICLPRHVLGHDEVMEDEEQ